MAYDDNFFNRSVVDAVKHGGDYWRNYQKLHQNDRVSRDRTMDADEALTIWVETEVINKGLPVARRYANWG